jgi:hypothetical protein
MADPVNTLDGHSYERSAIEQWFNDGKNTSPITGKTLIHKNLVPAFALRNAIHEVFPEARERFEAAFEVFNRCDLFFFSLKTLKTNRSLYLFLGKNEVVF